MMAEPSNTGAPNGGGRAPINVRVLGQYVKDLSFESPNVVKLLAGPPDNPQLNLEINVATAKTGPDTYEAAIDFKAVATGSIGTIYDFELVYAGLFKIENASPEVLEGMLNVNCPALLFPFLRRIVADLSREGGFQPLLLDPVDFAALYMRQKSKPGAVSATN